MKTAWFWLLTNVLILIIMFVSMRILDSGPSAPATDFDVDRAYSTLQALNPENLPHPSGSPQNKRLRDRIEQSLRGYGYEPSLQRTDYCTSLHPGCTAIENIVALKKGVGIGNDAILVTAHYDSAPVSPGAGDDLAGVAAMLVTASLIANEEFTNDVIFLFADGEETGLRGAMAFAEQHPEMARVKLALNFEARGVAGPSVMFETSDNNAKLIELFTEAAHRPVANSLMFEVYRKMPNNTDLTIYKNAGAAGLNFAFSRGVALYHSSRDSTANLSKRSLAHHGDNMLTVLRQAGSIDLSSLEADRNSTYVDLFGAALLHWPSALNLPASAIIICLLIVIGVRISAFQTPALLRAIAGAAAVFSGLVLCGWLLSFPLGVWPGIHPLDHPYPWPGRIAIVSASSLIAWVVGTTLCARAGAAASLFVNWMVITLFALVLAIALPGGAYLALVPAFMFAVIGLVETFINGRKPPIIAAFVGLIAAAYMSVYHFIFFDVVLNFQMSYLKMPILALLALASAPLAAIWRNEKRGGADYWPAAAVLASVTVVAAVIALNVPSYTPERPRSVNLAYVQETGANRDTHAQWRLYAYGPADRTYAEKAGFPKEQTHFKRFNAGDAKAYLQPATDHKLATPTLSVLSDITTDGVRDVKGELIAGRGGPMMVITFAENSSAIQFSVNGTTLIDAETFASGKTVQAYFNGFGLRPLPFELQIKNDTPLDLTLVEISELPDDPMAQSIIEMRPQNAAPIQFGDHSEVQFHYSF